MNKKYVAPCTNVQQVEIEAIMNTVSNPTGTNVDGLGISTSSYEGESRGKERDAWSDDGGLW